MSWWHKTLTDAENAVKKGDFKEFKKIIEGHFESSSTSQVPLKNVIQGYNQSLGLLSGMTRIDGPSKSRVLDELQKAKKAMSQIKKIIESLE